MSSRKALAGQPQKHENVRHSITLHHPSAKHQTWKNYSIQIVTYVQASNVLMSPNPTWILPHTSSPRRNLISHWSIHTSIMFSRTPCPFRGSFGHTNSWAQTWTYIWYWIVAQMCVPILTHTHIYSTSENNTWCTYFFIQKQILSCMHFPRQSSDICMYS
jgi:hypothetical protein